MCRPAGLEDCFADYPAFPGWAVRLKALLVREVKVLFRYTLSGLKQKVTASSRGDVGSNWK